MRMILLIYKPLPIESQGLKGRYENILKAFPFQTDKEPSRCLSHTVSLKSVGWQLIHRLHTTCSYPVPGEPRRAYRKSIKRLPNLSGEAAFRITFFILEYNSRNEYGVSYCVLFSTRTRLLHNSEIGGAGSDFFTERKQPV